MGAVCDNNWRGAGAKVACRQLGYAHGVATKGSQFGDVIGDFAMNDVNCTGEEGRLQDCRHNTDHKCQGGRAGVICSKVDVNVSGNVNQLHKIKVNGGAGLSNYPNCLLLYLHISILDSIIT